MTYDYDRSLQNFNEALKRLESQRAIYNRSRGDYQIVKNLFKIEKERLISCIDEFVRLDNTIDTSDRNVREAFQSTHAARGECSEEHRRYRRVRSLDDRVTRRSIDSNMNDNAKFVADDTGRYLVFDNSRIIRSRSVDRDIAFYVKNSSVGSSYNIGNNERSRPFLPENSSEFHLKTNNHRASTSQRTPTTNTISNATIFHCDFSPLIIMSSICVRCEICFRHIAMSSFLLNYMCVHYHCVDCVVNFYEARFPGELRHASEILLRDLKCLTCRSSIDQYLYITTTNGDLFRLQRVRYNTDLMKLYDKRAD